MKFSNINIILPTLIAGVSPLVLTHAFTPGLLTATKISTTSKVLSSPFFAAIHEEKKETSTSSSSLGVSVGLGPEEKKEEPVEEEEDEEKPPLVEPDHELFRDSRLTDFDRQCDAWFASLLGSDSDSFLGKVSEEASRRIHTLNKLERNPVVEDRDDEEWTPYQQNLLLDSPVLPAYGLEQYGLPTPRRNAEAWRHFDVTSLVNTDYSLTSSDIGSDLELDGDKTDEYTALLKKRGAWVDDDDCAGRLVYINGRFAPSLSYTTDIAKNLCANDFKEDGGSVSEDVIEKLNRLPDGFTDRLAADVPSGETDFLTSLKTLSGPNHNVGEPTSQFSINNQQGTACFVALNSVRAGSVASVEVPNDLELGDKPVLVVNAITADGGLSKNEDGKGVAMHPRTFVTAGDNSNLSFVQLYVDLNDSNDESFNQKLVNGCTQIYVGSGANVTHSYLEETGGTVTGGVEASSEEEEEGVESKKDIEAKRNELRDTYLESLDVHVTGEDGSYEVAAMCVGGSGKSRVSLSASLLKPGAHATVNGFSLAAGAQRTDFRTNIHHIAQGTTSRQSQKNMVGGRATTSFRGRIRVEQSAQQTDSEQLARTVLLSDKARIWAVPSLEIIADDVTCTHGATVSDLSEEELFYLRSRGLDKITSRNMLMYAFVDEIGNCIDEAVQGDTDDEWSLKNRVIKRLQNVVPQGDRAIKGDFQSV
eukprot:CAMPEP_0203666920 /NCGR_PEP_ID=MMETSP0090-20130426/3847_1 /ASSEMBLY_ACC=CAM_ASM_001088 /TAXON_ID=426623 /ORGANISM="Chaetoceros affinis, Strain CCMP159" /LENGTH=702 /DNA_ID=CAMNT_0050530921 /DNA_START=139 /DNA_END=2247 /DNA_ORIENTATION=-